MKTSKERQIEELAGSLEVPILFRNDIEKSDNEIILKWSDGKWFIFTIDWKLALKDDNHTISVNPNIQCTIQNAQNREIPIDESTKTFLA